MELVEIQGIDGILELVLSFQRLFKFAFDGFQPRAFALERIAEAIVGGFFFLVEVVRALAEELDGGDSGELGVERIGPMRNCTSNERDGRVSTCTMQRYFR